jgi:hypothetical protein
MPQAFSVLMLMVVFLQSPQAPGQDVQPSPETKPDQVPLREPFTLKLKLPGGSNYEEHFDPIPYVKDGSIYIFPGENFGLNAQVDGDKITNLSYVKNADKADIRLKFTEQGGGKGVMMLLVIESKLKQTLYLDAAMQIPNRKGEYKTSILPVFAGKGGFESWPHPISLLILRNLRFTK